MQKVDKFTFFKCFKCILICYNALIFFLGISEVIYLIIYKSFATGCQSIWSWILGASIANITIPIVTCFGLYAMCTAEDNKKIHIFNCLHVGQIIIALWSAVTYYNINSSCYSFWTSNAPEIWSFVVIHLMMMWIGVLIIFLIVCSVIIICCITHCFKSSTTDISSDIKSSEVIIDVGNKDAKSHLNGYGSIRVISADDISE